LQGSLQKIKPALPLVGFEDVEHNCDTVGRIRVKGSFHANFYSFHSITHTHDTFLIRLTSVQNPRFDSLLSQSYQSNLFIKSQQIEPFIHDTLHVVLMVDGMVVQNQEEPYTFYTPIHCGRYTHIKNCDSLEIELIFQKGRCGELTTTDYELRGDSVMIQTDILMRPCAPDVCNFSVFETQKTSIKIPKVSHPKIFINGVQGNFQVSVDDSVCTIASLSSELLEEKEFKAFPNPVQDELHFEQLPSEPLCVFNMYGTLLLKKQMQNTKLNVSNLPAGIYWIKVIGYKPLRFIKV
jgi:hypothetical protein